MHWQTRHALYAHELEHLKVRDSLIDKAATVVGYIAFELFALYAFAGWWAGL